MFFRTHGNEMLFIGRTRRLDLFGARRAVETIARGPGGLLHLRTALTQDGWDGKGTTLDDAAMLEEVARRIAQGRLVIVPLRPLEAQVPPVLEVDEPISPLAAGPPPEEDHPAEWLEIALMDGAGEPVAGAAYRVELENGTVLEGYLDDTGKKKFEGITKGSAKVTFPELDQEDWKPA